MVRTVSIKLEMSSALEVIPVPYFYHQIRHLWAFKCCLLTVRKFVTKSVILTITMYNHRTISHKKFMTASVTKTLKRTSEFIVRYVTDNGFRKRIFNAKSKKTGCMNVKKSSGCCKWVTSSVQDRAHFWWSTALQTVCYVECV